MTIQHYITGLICGLLILSAFEMGRPTPAAIAQAGLETYELIPTPNCELYGGATLSTAHKAGENRLYWSANARCDGSFGQAVFLQDQTGTVLVVHPSQFSGRGNLDVVNNAVWLNVFDSDDAGTRAFIVRLP